VIANYEERNGKEWAFYGRGFVLISDDDQIEILTEKEDIGIWIQVLIQGTMGEHAEIG